MSAGSRTSRELTEVRTVHSRAISALARLDADQRFRATGHPAYRDELPDPDAASIRAALERVVELTAPFARTRRQR